MSTPKFATTPEEQKQLDWCYLALTEEQIAACQEEAEELAGAELHQDEAAARLIPLLAKIITRNVRAEKDGDKR